MHIECITTHLKEALNDVARVTDSRGVLPILSHILLKAKEGKIQISATNLEIGVVVTLRGQIKKEGSVAIPAKLISEYIQTVSDNSIELSQKGEFDLRVSSSGSDIEIKGVDPGEFPLIPQQKNDDWIDLDMTELSSGLSGVLFATSKDISRPELSGVYASFKQGGGVLVSTDGHRLVETGIKSAKPPESVSCILPGKTAAEVARIFSKKEGVIKMQIGQGQIFFDMPREDGVSLRLTSKLIDGAYPDYTQIIPSDFEVEISMSRKDLITAIKGISLFASIETREIKMEYQEQGKTIKISSESAISGKGDVEIDVSPSPGNVSISFNFMYVLEGLQGLSGDTVTISFSGNDGPALFSQDGLYRYLVMPLDLS